MRPAFLRTGHFAGLHPAVAGTAAVIALVAACNVGTLFAAGPRHPATMLSDLPGRPPTRGTAADCQRAVTAFAEQVPEAVGYGLTDGVAPTGLAALYGADSPEVRTFTLVQTTLLTFFRQHGLSDMRGELSNIRPLIQRGCGSGG